ncbi:MAG: methyltransferase domain-containing protein [Thiobacillaceae bacterium]|nr:methyltransferase domain-containing protein [Thiobacillaceae bacterium]
MTPSPWLRRWARLIPAGGRVLDVACGGGRNSVYLASLGYAVTAVDRDLALSAPARDTPGITWLERDLEGNAWPFGDGGWQGVVVINYLHRPLLADLLAALAPGGALIYATFAHGQEVHGRPRNPEHLLMPGELIELVRGRLHIVAYEDVLETVPLPARRQRLAALKP